MSFTGSLLKIQSSLRIYHYVNKEKIISTPATGTALPPLYQTIINGLEKRQLPVGVGRDTFSYLFKFFSIASALGKSILFSRCT